MAWAALVRAANVGNNIFRPSELIARLPQLRMTSLGAAGTFAVQGGENAASVRAAIAGALPFTTEILVESAARWHTYVTTHAADPAPPEGARRYLALTARPVAPDAGVPLYFPDRSGWGVTITAIEGTFISGVYRRLEPRMLYPNAVVEKRFGVPATTRWWETVVALDERLREGPAPATGRRPRPTRAAQAASGRTARRAA